MNDADRKLEAAANEVCRQVGLLESDNLSGYLDSTIWNGQATPALRFRIYLNGRPVDEKGNVETENSRGHNASYYSGPGLAEAWKLIAQMKERALSLGLVVEPEIRYDARVEVSRPWTVLVLPQDSVSTSPESGQAS